MSKRRGQFEDFLCRNRKVILTRTLYYINVDSVQQGFVFANYIISSLKEYIRS